MTRDLFWGLMAGFILGIIPAYLMGVQMGIEKHIALSRRDEVERKGSK